MSSSADSGAGSSKYVRRIESQLAPYAARASLSGRQHAEVEPGWRSEYQRDRDRVIHSGAFRRLEYKTQVFINHEGDLFRTRLTHSIEVAQIARTVARALAVNEDLAEAVALAHDLGHTPFGHAGQTALNACMKGFGGFEHNLQSLRVIDKLECRYADFDGMNLMFETREGVLKHCSRRNAEALGPVAQRFLTGGQPSLEAQLVNVADEIAYNNHDIDDGLRAGLLTMEQLRTVPLFDEHYRKVADKYPDLSPRRMSYEIVREMIGSYVGELISNTQNELITADPQSIVDVRSEKSPLVGYGEAFSEKNQQLKRFLMENLYRHYRVHREMRKAQSIITRLFELFFGDARLLPPEYFLEARNAEGKHGESGRARVVADYIAGMTDRFAIDEYERLTDPRRLG